MAVILRATHIQERGGKNKGTDRQIPSRTTRDRHDRHTEEHTRQGWHLLRYTPPTTPTRAGSLWSTWGHAHRRGGGDRAAPAHLAPPALPQAPAGAPSVRARACVPAGARRHLWEERCALRPGRPGCAARGERLPWRAERGRILMGRPRALRPCRPTASAHSFLQLLPSHFCPRLGSRTPSQRA